MKPFKQDPAVNPGNPSNSPEQESDDEDDYMKMTFTDSPSTTSAIPETSLQRRQRLKREAEARGRVKSKAEIAAEGEAKREAALSKSLLEPSDFDNSKKPIKSKGLAMMAKMGFKPGGALGSKEAAGHARTEPIQISVKDGREGIGLESERKRKMREMAEAAGEVAKKARVDEEGYRERIRIEREEARMERQFHAAQKVAERMDDERGCADNPTAVSSAARRTSSSGDDDGGDKGVVRKSKSEQNQTKRPTSSRPLRSLPVVYRGLVRSREEAERTRRMRYDLEQSSSAGPLSSRLPTYIDPDEDEDDKRALGRTEMVSGSTTYITADDLDEEDEELEAFEALDVKERLRRAVLYMREEHKYCFWCKYAYPDEEMEGCPGLEEEDHD